MKGEQNTVKWKGDHRVKGSGICYPKESKGRHNLVPPVVMIP